MAGKSKQKYYAVRKGRTTGILLSWAECEASVIHFPGAEYKSFPTREEAEAFLKKTYTVGESPDEPAPEHAKHTPAVRHDVHESSDPAKKKTAEKTEEKTEGTK